MTSTIIGLHRILPLVLLCIITVIINTNNINGTPIKTKDDCHGTDCYIDLDYEDSLNTRLLENITKFVGQAFPEVTDLLQKIASSQNSILPVIVNLLEAEKILQASQHLMTNSLDQRNSTLRHISNLLEVQTEKLDRQNELLQVQQDMQQQLIYLMQTQQNILRGCTTGLSSGQYIILISPHNIPLRALPVYCDMNTDGGGWIVIQRRFDGHVNFDRNWVDYERGFGSLDGEFWLGLENLHFLTSGNSRFQLRVELHDFSDNHAYALYNDFQVGDSSAFYRLTLGSYSGTAGNSMSRNNGREFSTKDEDHDRWRSGNCAKQKRSGWWHSDCTYANPNGLYRGRNTHTAGMYWYHWKNSWNAVKKSEMKIRLAA